MSDEQVVDYASVAPGYSPPQNTASNQDQAAFAAAVAAQVQAQLAALGVKAVPQARELTPEEAARAAIDNAGVGLGIDERLAELYRHLNTIAKKVGV